jgi:hypothetical protein
MRSGLLIAFLVIVLASATWAEGIPKVRDGDMQLVFEFNGLSLLDLNTYAGGVGFRYFYYDEFAFRGSFNFAYGKLTEKVSGADTSRTWIGGTFIVEKYLIPISSVAPYIGGGLGYYWNREWHPQESIGFSAPKRDLSTTSTIFEVPLVGGFQWYFANAFSLGGEYRLAYRYTKEKTQIEDQEGEIPVSECTHSSFGFSAVSVFLSVHIPR